MAEDNNNNEDIDQLTKLAGEEISEEDLEKLLEEGFNEASDSTIGEIEDEFSPKEPEPSDDELRREETEERQEVQAEEVTPEPEVTEEEEEFDPVSEIKRLKDQLDQERQLNRTIQGRVAKMQSDSQKRANTPPPTKEDFNKALESDEAMQRFVDEWPDHKDALRTVVNLVGDKLDSKNQALVSKIEELEQKRTLDMAVPGWENDLNDPKFYDWLLEGGPSKQEFETYNQMARDGDPRAEDLKSQMLTKYDNWAGDKGYMYFDDNTESAVNILKKHRSFIKEIQDREKAKTRKKSALESNAAPSKGRSVAPMVEPEKSIEELLEEGFNSPTYR